MEVTQDELDALLKDTEDTIKTPEIFNVYFAPFAKPEEPELVSQFSDEDEAKEKIKELKETRPGLGIACYKKNEDTTIFEQVVIKLSDGTLLPEVELANCKLVEYPKKQLKLTALDVPPDSIEKQSFKELISLMAITMYYNKGIGIAAPQIGAPVKAILVDIEGQRTKNTAPTLAINPEILYKKKIAPSKEGCLSVPGGYRQTIDRYSEITVKFLDVNGEQQLMGFKGQEAFTWQHEIDHLNGVLFIDYLSHMKRDLYRRGLKRTKNRAKKQAKKMIRHFKQNEKQPVRA